jgi:hypothetical protein
MTIELIFVSLIAVGLIGIKFPGLFQWLCDW